MKRITTLAAAGLVALGLAPAVQAQSSSSAHTSATRYDVMGRVTGTIAAAAPAHGYPKFLATRTTYDDAGRPTRIESGYLVDWQSENIAPASWETYTTFKIMKTVETTYNAQNQKLTEKVRGETVGGVPGAVYGLTQYSYDTSGRLLCTAVRMNPAIYGSLPSSACTPGTPGTLPPNDGPDRITKNIYDAAGQMVQLREGVGGGTGIEAAEVTYSYTDNGKIKEVVDAGGHRSLMCYDGLDRKVRWVFPSTTNPASFVDTTPFEALGTANAANGSCTGAIQTTHDVEAYEYDPNGNRTKLRKRDAREINYEYDPLNRMTRKDIVSNDASNRDVHYGYNARGLTTSIRFDSSSGEGITNTFDGFDMMVGSTTSMDGNTRALGYYYDHNGNLAQLTHPDGTKVDYVLDGMDRLYYAAVNNNPMFLPVKDDAGRLNALYRWNGSAYGPATGFSYEPTSRVLAYTHFFNTSSYNSTTSFAWNPAGQIAASDRSNDSFAWNGQVALDRNYNPNGLNQYSSTVVGGSTTSYCFDANGNLTADGTYVYRYDIENRLLEKRTQINTTCTSLNYTGALQASLRYDPMGRLHEVTDGASVFGGKTRFLHDRDMLLAEYDVPTFGTGGNILRRYVHGTDAGDDPRVWFEGSSVADSARRYLWVDERGSIIGVTDNAGNLTSTGVLSYDEYGITTTSSGDIPTRGRFRYTGQAWLPELGMYYYKARIYSPVLGRFLQTDPIGYDDQFNLYAYVGNDPINGVDPTGMFSCQKKTGSMLCQKARGDQAAAARQISGVVKQLAGIARKYESGKKLNTGEQRTVARFEKYLGKGSASNAEGVAKLAQAGARMAEALANDHPLKLGGAAGTAYATAPSSPGKKLYSPVSLYDRYFLASDTQRRFTIAHEAAHFGLNIGFDLYGEARAAEYARINPQGASRVAENWAFAYGFTRDD